ncbi:hypothetical protein ACFV4T_19245 [Streptomyces sp. NPDC059755]|uniref:hypothetical protein n=1 Tax=Streptomyces sp. NPDC059755 TaxID=3346934 RepID=UPI003658DBFE
MHRDEFGEGVTRTAGGRRAGQEFLARLKERTADRDKVMSPIAFNNQLKAIHRWGLEKPHDLSVVRQPVLVANGGLVGVEPVGEAMWEGAYR